MATSRKTKPKTQRKSATTNRRNTTSSAKARAPSAPKKTLTPSASTAASSKQAKILEMLHAPAGATIAAVMKATGWQQHSVRGFLAGTVRTKLKLNLTSEKINGQRVYRIVKTAPAQ